MDAFQRFVTGLPDNLSGDWQKDFQKISSMLPKDIVPFAQDRYAHVLIVPDGFMSLLPVELLPTASGQPLLETRDVTYMPSAVLLLRGAIKMLRPRGCRGSNSSSALAIQRLSAAVKVRSRARLAERLAGRCLPRAKRFAALPA